MLAVLVLGPWGSGRLGSGLADPDPVPVTGTWASGAAGDGAADGDFGAWRGAPIDIAATWNDSLDAQTAQYTIQPGAEYADWDGDLDLSVGAIYSEEGETWQQAAEGAYDDRWRTALEAIATARADTSGTLYLRFAHEFNGDWEPWAVTGDDAPAFRDAWVRFRALQQEILPDAQLVFCPTSETSSSLGLDWRDALPPAGSVDLLSVDYYNQYPYVDDVGGFEERLGATDGEGAPRGLEAYRMFAESQGLPLAISEWSSNADMGDAPVFVEQFHTWVATHAGTGPGQIPYEIHFNVGDFGDAQFQFFPDTRQPEAAAAYARLW